MSGHLFRQVKLFINACLFCASNAFHHKVVLPNPACAVSLTSTDMCLPVSPAHSFPVALGYLAWIAWAMEQQNPAADYQQWVYEGPRSDTLLWETRTNPTSVVIASTPNQLHFAPAHTNKMWPKRKDCNLNARYAIRRSKRVNWHTAVFIVYPSRACVL